MLPPIAARAQHASPHNNKLPFAAPRLFAASRLFAAPRSSQHRALRAPRAPPAPHPVPTLAFVNRHLRARTQPSSHRHLAPLKPPLSAAKPQTLARRRHKPCYVPPTPRRSGRAVEGTGFENRRTRKGTVGSNPSSSASDAPTRRCSARESGPARLRSSPNPCSRAPGQRRLLKTGSAHVGARCARQGKTHAVRHRTPTRPSATVFPTVGLASIAPSVGIGPGFARERTLRAAPGVSRSSTVGPRHAACAWGLLRLARCRRWRLNANTQATPSSKRARAVRGAEPSAAYGVRGGAVGGATRRAPRGRVSAASGAARPVHRRLLCAEPSARRGGRWRIPSAARERGCAARSRAAQGGIYRRAVTCSATLTAGPPAVGTATVIATDTAHHDRSRDSVGATAVGAVAPVGRHG